MDDPPFPREIELHIFREAALQRPGGIPVLMRVAWWVKECCGRQCGAAAVQRLESSDPEAGPTLNTPFPVLSPSAFRALIEDPRRQAFIAQSTGLRLDGELSSSETNTRQTCSNSAQPPAAHHEPALALHDDRISRPLRARASHTSTCRSTTAGRKSGRRFWRFRDAPPLDMLLDVLSDPHRRLNVFVLSYQRWEGAADERLIEHPACLLVHQGIGWPEWQDEWTGGATSAGFWERVDKMLAERRSAGAPGKYDNDCAFNLLSSVKHTKSTDIIRLRNLVERRRGTLYAPGTPGVDWWPGTPGWCRLLSYTSADKSRARTADTAEGPTAKKAVCQRDPNPQREGLHRPDAPLDSLGSFPLAPLRAGSWAHWTDVLLTRDGPGGDRFGKPYRGWWYILFVQGRCSVKPSSGVSEAAGTREMMWWKSGAAGAFPAASCALDIRLPVSELVFRFAIGDSEPEGDLWSWIHILDLAMLVKFTWCIDKRLLSLARLSRRRCRGSRVRHLVLRIQNSLVLTHSGIEQLPRTFPGLEQLCVQVIDGPYNTEMAASEPALLPAVLPCTPFVNKLKIWNEAAGRLLFTLQRIERYIPPTITNVALQSDNGNYSLWSGILAFFPNLRTLDFRVKESSGDSRPSEAPHFLASLSTILPPTLESLRVHICASRSRDGLRRSIWRGLSNPSLFAGESDTQGGGLYWAETSGVKSAADGPDGKQQGTTEGGDKVRVLFRPRNWVLIVSTRVQVFHGLLPPPTALRLPQTPPARSPTLQSIPIPLLSTCPHVLSSPRLRRKSDALPPVGPQRSARAALLSRRLSVFAHSPLALAELSTGLTLGGSVVGESVKDIMQAAFENGINMFDTAEDYQKGAAEREMGHAIKELGWRRTDLVISTKIFWSHEPGTGPNDTGLSHKHVIEGTKACLRRLQMDYVDVIFAHRCDTTVPMEEIVRAFNYVIDQGWAFYWGTSEWSAPDRGGASTDVATRLNLIAPIAEQCKHKSAPSSFFLRNNAEETIACSTANVRRRNTAPLYARYGLGTTAFSALQGGLLTGKTARAATVPMFRGATEGPQGEELLWKVRLLSQIAAGASFLPDLLNSGRNRAGAAWVAAHRHTSTVILGVSSVAQLEANLGALEVLPKLDAAVLARIEAVLGNHPQEPETYGRPPLDQGIL
ncbi:Aldo-ket-red domain-containing protein [Mycena indigotica]|uniref:Aldo-ket-red domain-containing protein n=1 Tax=Mycena indigotica TaxID=2126181 RepID=A0A8H6RX37_9AGAR|nr:Aldo-ket-red domain-containing protein [Mycena indigotica]KAF7288487.1 Aldo-ket-red domain-containing protein [Mycena indigotica]